MTGLAVLHLTFSLAALPPLPSDTPPTLPVPISELANIKSARDVVAITLLADGSRAPEQLVLPQLDNRRHTLEYMRVHYPESMRDVTKKSVAVAWLHVDDTGKVGAVQLLTTSGFEPLDSLSLEVLRIAMFKPATRDGKPVGVWLPFPAAIPPYQELIDALEKADQPLSEAPREVAYTQKPILLNRNQVEAAIIRVIHSLDPQVRQWNEALARAQGAGGIALVDIFLDTEGVVRNAVLKKTTGNRDLDDAALNVSRIMRFSPARNDKTPVDVWIEVPIRFVKNTR